MQTKKVLVMYGGFSAEREVSLISGKEIAAALRNCGYDVVEHDLVSVARFLEVLEKEKPNVVFNALHGNWGEDGTIQGFLDLLQIPYTHSGMGASFLGMNKQLTKDICLKNQICTAPYEVMTYGELKRKGTSLDYPYVAKPRNDGSSVNVFIVQNEKEKDRVNFGDDNLPILIEKYIPGQEITVAVLEGKACGVTELKPQKGFYDYQAKYTSGLTTHLLPAQIPESAAKEAMHAAEKIHTLLGCQTLSRSDFRYNKNDGVVFLEINTHPGMTSLSLVPEQARHIGITFERLCQKLVENAQCRKL